MFYKSMKINVTQTKSHTVNHVSPQVSRCRSGQKQRLGAWSWLAQLSLFVEKENQRVWQRCGTDQDPLCE